jgi:hypothetical protein
VSARQRANQIADWLVLLYLSRRIPQQRHFSPYRNLTGPLLSRSLLTASLSFCLMSSSYTQASFLSYNLSALDRLGVAPFNKAKCWSSKYCSANWNCNTTRRSFTSFAKPAPYQLILCGLQRNMEEWLRMMNRKRCSRNWQWHIYGIILVRSEELKKRTKLSPNRDCPCQGF